MRPRQVGLARFVVSGVKTQAGRGLGRESIAIPSDRDVPRRPKRFLDIALSGLGLAGSAPLWVVIAIAIKLEDGGPMFYSQERVGRAGRLFKTWKFRSMAPDADKQFSHVQAGEDDPRTTRVGRLLRATAMDELPQLWSIFNSDMSFVGPRALLPAEIEVQGSEALVQMDSIPGYEERQTVTPGLTGVAQTYAPRDLPRRHKFKYDLLYVRNQSFWLDVRLILLSFWITFKGTWESRQRKF